MVILRKNQKGQFLIEAVLLMFIFMSAFLVFSRVMKEQKVVQNLVQRPWGIIAGMIETGNWKPIGESRKIHPNRIDSVLTKKCGDDGGC